jgi:lipopolysaccharide transport system ATP-binding protein
VGTIIIEGLSKAYKWYPTRWARLGEWLMPRRGPRHEQHWVLSDINLDIARGESLGIIGTNGAGKSTLLKLITGTTQPTAGSVATEGQVAALLELGMGFHPDFTGRQNVIMAGQLLGHDPATLHELMPGIEAFADIGEYIDQPVRVYSSGMQMRLAFSIATAVRPDVLIIDEALSVGDVFFQQKCFNRIRSYLEQGTTLLFVSHALSSVHSLCDRAILMEHGRILLDATPREVIDLYNGKLAADTSHQRERVHVNDTDADGTGTIGSYQHEGVSIEHATLHQAEGRVHAIVSGSYVRVRVTLAFHEPFADPHVGLQIRDDRGEAIFMSNTHAMLQRIGRVDDNDRVTVSFGFRADIAPGDYTVTVGVGDTGVAGGQLAASLARIQDACAFSIIQDLEDIVWSGVSNLRPDCEIRRPIAESAPLPGTPRLLVTTSHSLLEVDLERRAIVRRHSGYGTYYGLTDNGNHAMVAARRRRVSSPVHKRNESGAILALDRRYKVLDQWQAPFPLRDMHEIRWHQGELWVTCTYDNLIAILRTDWTWDVWYPLGQAQGPDRDINHINSITFEADRVHLLAHNWGESEVLTFALPSRELITRRSLGEQAHNLWFEAGQWLTCSSVAGKIVGSAGFEYMTGAFPRGVAHIAGQRIIGLSAIAERDKRDFADGELLILDADWRETGRISLPGEGLVLDLLALDPATAVQEGQ